MKLRVREGWYLFKSQDDALTYELGSGRRGGIKPLAAPGDIISDQKLIDKLSAAWEIGKLEPIDAEAIAVFGHVTPIISRLVTHPEIFVPRPELTRELGPVTWAQP